MPVRAIEIGFAEPVELTEADERELVAIAGRMCDRYERANPERVMWPAGIGQKMLTNPFMATDDEPLEFDESVFQIDCYEREKYEDRKDRPRHHLYNEDALDKKADETTQAMWRASFLGRLMIWLGILR